MKKLVATILRKAAQMNYYTAKYYSHFLLSRQIQGAVHPPLLIYQMGKVGSTSVEESLRALDLGIPIFHIHFLTDDLMDFYEEKRRKFFRTRQQNELSRIWMYRYLSKTLRRGTDHRKWKVITLVRDPITRNISSFFETLRVESGQTDGLYKISADIRSPYSFDITVSIDNISELIRLFIEKFDHETPLIFFDRQIKSMLGIDVFAYEFPKSKGYMIYRGRQVELLLIRLENLNECAETAFKEFLSIKGFVLKHANVGREKIYAPLYRKFKSIINLPDTYINDMYASKFMRHFYSRGEIEEFKAKWNRAAA
jgi:hypothetical protein